MDTNIIEIDNFINDNESDLLINLGDLDLKRMAVLGSTPHSDYRIAQGTWLPNNNPLVMSIQSKIANIVNLPIENMEQVHIVKYDVGGEYKVHHDFFHPNTDYYADAIKRGGQRAFTALIYLNDNFDGGETDFPILKKNIKPKKNKLIIWKNLKDNGDLDYDSLHAGLPVKQGSKYIAIIWIRQNKF